VLAVQHVHNRLYYCVKWTGLDYNPVWYNPDGFKRSLHKLKEFYNQYLNKPGLLHYLADWLQCYEKGTEAEKQ
jgi:hypothetical protein